MFSIIGDSIVYDGETVATIRADLIPTLRERFEGSLKDCDPENVEELEQDVEEFKKQRDAYAAILGVDPDGE